MTLDKARALLLLVLVLGLLALGCSSSTASTRATAVATPKPLPDVPSDPLLLLPGEATGVLSVKLSELRASPHFRLFSEYLSSQPCLAPSREQALLSRVDQTLVAYLEDSPSQPDDAFVMLVKGSLAQNDEQLVLEALRRPNEGAAVKSVRGRFTLWTQGSTTASRLRADLIAFGNPRALEAVLALADDRSRARFVDGELLGSTGIEGALATSSFALVARPDERTVRRAGRTLGSIGLPHDLLSGSVALTAKLHDNGLDLAARVTKPSSNVAADTAAALNRKLGQLGLLARIAGLPPVLDHVAIAAEQLRVQASVTLSNSELTALYDRLLDMLKSAPSPCPRDVAAPGAI